VYSWTFFYAVVFFFEMVGGVAIAWIQKLVKKIVENQENRPDRFN
jgi:hypothetical protein